MKKTLKSLLIAMLILPCAALFMVGCGNTGEPADNVLKGEDAEAYSEFIEVHGEKDISIYKRTIIIENTLPYYVIVDVKGYVGSTITFDKSRVGLFGGTTKEVTIFSSNNANSSSFSIICIEVHKNIVFGLI